MFTTITGSRQISGFHPSTVGAILGSTLLALLLTGSARTATNTSVPLQSPALAEIVRLRTAGKNLYAAGKFREARDTFRIAATRAEQTGNRREAAMNWTNTGNCSLILMQFRVALREISRARAITEGSRDLASTRLFTLNALASLYLHMGQPERAIRVAQEALADPAAKADPVYGRLLVQIAMAKADQDQFDQAEPIYRQALAALMDRNDLDGAARVWSAFGDDSLSAGRLDMAEWALCEALRLARIHRLNATASILSGLAKLKSRQGDERSAEALFAAALAAPPNMTPRQAIYSNRGQSRLQFGNLRGALADFREARRIADQMRADIVPADQDRIKLESGLSKILQGLVDAGNRLARQTGDRTVLEETFDAAEQDRLWSLRALVPSPNDWRSRLPDRYWEALAEFQSLERTAVEQRTPEIEKNIAGLQVELQQIEANAAGTDSTNSVPTLHPESPLAHVRRILDDDTVLLSFHVSKTSSWVWAVDRRGVDVYPVRLLGRIAPQVTEFSRAIKEGRPAAQLGREIYGELFGTVAERYLRHRRWLLELDGPLYELPFAALTAGGSDGAPRYLIERAALQSIPNALLLEPGVIPGDGGFLGVGDPVYNTADSRYRGSRGNSDLTLPRLPNTAAELDACARAWSSQDSRLLTGPEARSNTLQAALKTNPAIIHFATHVVTAPGEFRSGMIALSLDPAGEMGLLGPEEIVARPVAASLVVMDGCHSAQGESLPSAGLMGLTRAWIGAGAKAVMATQWDVPDDAAESLMTEFYRALRSDPNHRAAVALREAQLSGLRKDPKSSGSWAGYFLLSKVL